MRTVAPLNDHDVMFVNVKGVFYWHSHAKTGDFSNFKRRNKHRDKQPHHCVENR